MTLAKILADLMNAEHSGLVITLHDGEKEWGLPELYMQMDENGQLDIEGYSVSGGSIFRNGTAIYMIVRHETT